MENIKTLIEKWNETVDLERWEKFAETMWAMGFEMDGYESFKNAFGNFSCSNEKGQKAVLKNLAETADIKVVGNFIFSHWRYLTHWSYGYNVEKEGKFFKELFKVLLCKEK